MGMSGARISWARRNLVAAVVAAIFVLIAMLAMASPALADSFVVTTTEDTPYADAAVCDSNCSLREAVRLANSNAAADTITFDVPDAGPHTITLTQGQIFFATTHKTTLDGTGESVTVSGNNASRVFNVREGNVTVKRLTVSGGYVGGCCDNDGGGIYVQGGNLAVIESTVSGNTATTGGGIFSFTNLSGTSTTTIENSTISGNTATFSGGGIYNDHGQTTITSSTITQNYASSLYQSSGGGAGVASYGDTATETVVANSIISDNSSNCSVASACIFRHDGDVDFVSGGLHPHNSFTSQGYNIIGDSSLEYDTAYRTAGTAIGAFNKTGDQRGVTDPKLGPLQDNGGPTQTHALLTGSLAINRGSTTLATDQRGVSRQQGAADDVGAFELEVAVNVAPSFTKGADQTVDEDASEQTVTGWATAISGGPSNESTQTVSFTATTNNDALFSDQPQVSSDGTLTYTPAANANGTATVTVTARDSGGTADGGVDTSAAQTFTITVTAADDDPVAVDDNRTVAEDDAATTIDVRSNDTDVDGGAKSVQSVTQPAYGTVTVTNGGADLTYKPNADYCNGGSPTDDFDYTLNGGSTAKVAVTVTCVNDAPVAKDDSLTTNEDTAGNGNMLTNDTDVDSANITATKVTEPTHGTLTFNADGSYTYTPNADFNGSDSFTYEAKDAGLDSNSATVSITVTAVNDAPVAGDDTKTTAEDTPLTFPSSDLVTNDDEGASDESAQTLTVTEVFDGTHGTVDLGTDGNITFTPEANFNGDATFTYRVCDNGGPSKCSIETATVNVTVSAVNDAPVAKDQSVTTNEDTAVEVSLGASDVEGDALGYAIMSDPAHGTLTGSGANQTYTPNNNYNGTDSFTFKANDGTDDSNTATVDITVKAVNDAPDAVNDSATTNEDTATNIDVLANDTDVDNTNAQLSVSSVGAAGHATATKNADGTIKYVPDADYSGPDSFTYTVSDGNGGADFATVNVTVTPVNDPPAVALTSGGSCSTSTTSVSGTMNLSLADVDSTVGGLTLSATSSNQALVPAANIKFSGSGANRTVSITPAAKKTGSSTITVTASDGKAKSTESKITVIVGTDKKETINGTPGSDMVFGLNGDDTINAGNANDLVCGGNAGGVINGGAGDDTLDGGNGNDTLRGDEGNDILRGGQGNDRLEGGNDVDTLTGGAGADSFSGGAGSDTSTDYTAREGDTRDGS